jgi:hypothetical protein
MVWKMAGIDFENRAQVMEELRSSTGCGSNHTALSA